MAKELVTTKLVTESLTSHPLLDAIAALPIGEASIVLKGYITPQPNKKLVEGWVDLTGSVRFQVNASDVLGHSREGDGPISLVVKASSDVRFTFVSTVTGVAGELLDAPLEESELDEPTLAGDDGDSGSQIQGKPKWRIEQLRRRNARIRRRIIGGWLRQCNTVW